MLTDSKIMAFVATAQPEQAKVFYADVLGLRLTEDGQFALVFDAGGTILRVQKVREVASAGYTALGWTVPDIAAAVRTLAASGVTFNRYQGLPQDELGVWKTPDGSQVAWFDDPDGNILSLTQLP